MKFLAILSAALLFGLTLTAGDAEAARRLGSGKSTGMQREAVSPQKTASAPTTANTAKPQAAPAQPQRSWMGPLAGLAAGLGLAALASYFGFGPQLASLLLIGLLVMAVLFVIGLIMRKRAAAAGQPALAAAGESLYAPARFESDNPSASGYAPQALASAMPISAASGNIPADFDIEAFIRNAKINFIRLQAANDSGNLEDIRQFTTPEMFAECKMSLVERGAASQATDVVKLEAEVLDVAEETERYVVSVRFTGFIRETIESESFDEIWHMLKPRDGSHGWVLAGIQQVQ